MKLLTATLLSFPLSCFAAGWGRTGNDLYGMMISNDPFEIMQAHRYLQGVLDYEEFNKEMDARSKTPITEVFICIPTGVTNQQILDVVKKGLEERPQTRHTPAFLSARYSLWSAWPCRR